jgi:hypothetical protein
MFDHELKPEPSIAWLIVQQLGAFFGPLMLVMLLGTFFGDLLSAVLTGVISFAVGMGVQATFPDKAGCWVWVLPACGFLIAFGSDCASFSWRFATAEFFWPGPDGEAWLALMFLTVPTACSCLYSAGIFFARSRTMQ